MADELFLIDGNSARLPRVLRPARSRSQPRRACRPMRSSDSPALLVKILTDYGPKATVVVWDRGHSGRKDVYTEYKAGRSSRPDLLKEQWPHFEPLVEAFGYRNIGVDGYEADDVIASIAEQAKQQEPPIEVMIVTGDRDAYQLVDERVRIMTTSRGITDTRVYDRDGVIDRYGIPPELVPDFLGLKGDTSDNIPRRSRDRGQDGRRPACSGSDRWRRCSIPHRGDLRRQAQAESHRARRRRAHLQAAGHRPARDPPRRAGHRRLRLPAARPLQAARHRSVSSSCASRCAVWRRRWAPPMPPRPRPEAEQALHAKTRQATPSDLTKALPADRRDHGRRPAAPRPPRTRSSDPTIAGPTASTRPARTSSTPAAPTAPRISSRPIDPRPVIAHNVKALGQVPAHIAHDTEIGAYLLEPARRAYPFRELCEERGFATDVQDGDGAGADARLVRCAGRSGSARRSADGDSRTFSTTSSCRSCGSCARWSRSAVRLDTERAGRDLDPGQGGGRPARDRDL